jgi:hypothetical protein
MLNRGSDEVDLLNDYVVRTVTVIAMVGPRENASAMSMSMMLG